MTEAPTAAEASTAELVRRATEQMSHLVRDELALARAEMAQKGKNAGVGIGLFGGSGVFLLYGIGVLIAAGVLALALVMPAWLSALLVGVFILLIAGVMALVGRARVKRAVPLKPTETVESVQADIATLRGEENGS
ncbi:phage holin family protein [Phytomonospora endophytica]|uniref:Flp pilus assembly protein TadB n=1 Tax=Phytomonospora endophytica TaxID=714109 RepID=A0A841FTW8_9ACTN|nr:phage holin family protein [Phytomonospora endophytica]MBB6039785.1 Flp pilus assembly protein TadB [Phytomonospora endophytica]GIG70879.1 membrane protein [Phytomonospora endophytica]